jgi:hypothetical protein
MAKHRPVCAKTTLPPYRARLRRPGAGILDISVLRTGMGFISAAIAACLSTPVHAQSSSLNGEVALSSQLVDRGLPITPETPILQGAGTWTSPSGWSLGLSGSTETDSPGHFTEAQARGSRYWLLATDWQMQASLLYYNYSGSVRFYDRAEAGVNWIYRDILTLGLSAISVVGSPDHRLRGAADLNFHWPLAWNFSVSAGLGIAQPLLTPYNYEVVEHTNLYGYGMVGLVWAYGSWRAEFDHVMTDSDMRRQRGGPGTMPWIVTISRSF